MGRELAHMGRQAGFDALRLIGVLAIFAQHVCSVAGLDDHAVVGGFRIGRFGTAALFAMSGYFAAVSPLAPTAWLARRAGHLLPAFWVVTTIGFIAAAVTGHKRFDAWQVVCQMAAIGPLTHPDDMVNVGTWFVSLLGVLYLVVYIARRTNERGGVGLAVAVTLVYAAVPQWHRFDVMACHATTFFAGYALAWTGGRLTGLPLALVAVMAALLPLQPILSYGVTAVVLLRVAAAIRADWAAGRVSGRYAYEWFLVHGLCLHTARTVVGPQVWAMAPLAAGLAVVAAVGLREGLDALRGRSVLLGRAVPRLRSHGASAERPVEVG